MNINNKFNLNDNIFFISKEYTKKTCRECKGLGVISNENSTHKCHTCDGEKTNTDFTKKQWIVSNRKYQINKIEATLSNTSTDIHYRINSLKIKESDIFKSLEEAVEECTLRNSKELENNLNKPVTLKEV